MKNLLKNSFLKQIGIRHKGITVSSHIPSQQDLEKLRTNPDYIDRLVTKYVPAGTTNETEYEELKNHLSSPNVDLPPDVREKILKLVDDESKKGVSSPRV